MRGALEQCRFRVGKYRHGPPKSFDELDTEAAAGKLSRREYATKKLEIESIAAEKSRAFYIRVILPLAKRAPRTHASAVVVRWAAMGLERESLSCLDRRRRSALAHYERHFDAIVLDSLIRKGEDDKVSRLTAEMKKRAAGNAELAKFLCARPRLDAERGDWDKAIAECREAIRLDPKNDIAVAIRVPPTQGRATSTTPSPT